MTYKKKLIEVALPLEAINVASAREKSIRHGHPSTLHLWWARRPLAAARAVIFAQMVDDPSAHPDIFKTEKAQEKETKPKKKEGFSFDFGGEAEEEPEAQIPGPWRKAKRLEVRVGFEDGDIAELLDGVEEGAALVVVGNQALRDAARVRLPEDPTLEPKKEDEPALPGTGDAAAAAAAEAG